MTTPEDNMKQDKLESEVADMDIKEEQRDEYEDVDMDTISVAQPQVKEGSAATPGPATPKGVKRQSISPVKKESMAQSPVPKTEVVGGDVELRLDADERPTLARSRSHKIARRSPELFTDTPDATTKATSTFSLLRECVYANKHLGTTEHALECECAEEWGKYSNQILGYHK